MTTNKERAETWRRIADCYESLGEFMREAADRATKLGHGSNVTRAVRQVLRGYADALDAEAGEQS